MTAQAPPKASPARSSEPPAERPSLRWIPLAGGILGLAAVYFLSGTAGLSLAFHHPSATPVWPPSGIALAALLRFGSRLWPGILLGAFFVNLTTPAPVESAAAIAVGNTLEGVLAAALLRRFAGGLAFLDRAPDFFRFVLLSGLFPTALAATVGCLALAVRGAASWTGLQGVWLTWWLGDAVSILILVPLFFSLTRPGAFRIFARRRLEAVGLLLATGLVGMMVFGGWFPAPIKTYPIAFLTLPVFVWAAFRFHQPGAVASVGIVSVIAVWGDLRGHGPFVRADPNEGFLLLQSFMGVAAVTILALASVVAERWRAAEQVRELNLGLERRVRERTSELAELAGDLDSFAYSVSHDLRAPLRAMHGFGQILLEEYPGRVLDAEGVELVRRLHDAGGRMDRLIEDLLAYSRLSREELVPEPVVLGEAVEEALRQLSVPLKERDAEVIVEPSGLAVLGQRAMLVQVVANLVSNAVKFVAPGTRPRVLLRTRSEAGRVRLSVEDNGIGIAPEHRGRIFRVFERLHARDVYPGSGVGLAIVKRAVERMGGTLGFESEVGRGSTFWFELPGAAA